MIPPACHTEARASSGGEGSTRRSTRQHCRTGRLHTVLTCLAPPSALSTRRASCASSSSSSLRRSLMLPSMQCGPIAMQAHCRVPPRQSLVVRCQYVAMCGGGGGGWMDGVWLCTAVCPYHHTGNMPHKIMPHSSAPHALGRPTAPGNSNTADTHWVVAVESPCVYMRGRGDMSLTLCLHPSTM